MGLLLALHLGVVLALFFTPPYGKFVHGLYRFMALVRSCEERRAFGGRIAPSRCDCARCYRSHGRLKNYDPDRRGDRDWGCMPRVS